MTDLQTYAFSRRRIIAAGAASLALAGCGGGLLSPSQDPLKIYVLKPQFQPLDDLPRVSRQLTIAEPDATQSLQTLRIALVHGETMDYYADAQWTDPAPRLVQSLLVEAFETSGRIKGVAPESAGIHGDAVLETEIRTFEADYRSDSGAPTVNVTIVARLLASGRGEVVGTFMAHHETGAAQNTIASVVEAFDEATGQALEDIVRWTLKGLPETAAPRA